jgi:GT2 family glycosyltransferase
MIVGIATVGRSELVGRTIDRVLEQSRLPDGIVVVGSRDEDVAEVRDRARTIVDTVAERGLCRQRNHILDLVGGQADLLVFLDDDFVPTHTYLERAEQLFVRSPEVTGATGRIIADGIHSKGFAFEEAVRLADSDGANGDAREFPAEALYGCNMVLRLASMEGLRFDEALPLYGWLEDIDLTYRLSARGPLVRSFHFAGVHMGAKGGRTSGYRLGYSQIANPIHLLRKGSAPPRLARRMMARNLTANLARSLWPEPHVDRRGRLRGNILALFHLMTRQLDPRRVQTLNERANG